MALSFFLCRLTRERKGRVVGRGLVGGGERGGKEGFSFLFFFSAGERKSLQKKELRSVACIGMVFPGNKRPISFE